MWSNIDYKTMDLKKVPNWLPSKLNSLKQLSKKGKKRQDEMEQEYGKQQQYYSQGI